MRSMKHNRWVALVLAALLALTSAAAQADTLEALKAAGVVGERADGYLGAVQDTIAADAMAVVTEVNAKRRAEYERIAAAHGLERTKVEALAGKKTLARTASGAWIFVERWQRKP